ncbi:FAD-dependent oxidoreductase [soil metagenome]
MQDSARVVVVGGGCVGVSILYGLAKRGWRDCLLLERTQLAGASTRLAGGVIPTYVRSDALSRLINKTIDIYKGLEAETGLAVDWHNCGQMRIARNPARLDEYKSYMNTADAIGANAALLSPEAAVALWPLIESKEGIYGALYHPDDGYVGPTDVTMSLAKGARDRGARIRQNTKVTDIRRLPGGEWNVVTSGGSVVCEHVVLATGTYARQSGALLGLDIPALPVIVQYWITDSVPEIVERKRQGLPEMPITRDDHFLGYVREQGDGLMFGTYERPQDLQLFAVHGVPDDYDGEMLPPDFGAHAWGFERGCEVMPALARTGIKSNVRGPMQMTADGLPLVGPAWGLKNVWLAEGVPGGILWGGTIGHTLSEWIVEGETTGDLNELDPRRFGDHATKQWTKLKAVEIWGTHSDIIAPGTELPAARPARTSPSYDLLREQGAVWGAVNGWEVANWYAPEGVEPVDRLGYRRTPIARYIDEEAGAIRHAAGLVELTDSAKFEVSGRGAAGFLDREFATALPAVGHVAAGYQLFGGGGVRAAYTVARLEHDLFYLVSGARTERLNFDALWRLLPDDGTVLLRNATMERGAIAVTGPHARAVLQPLIETSLSNDDFPLATVAIASAGLASDVRMLRTSLAGELGWELYAPIAYQRHLIERLLDLGTPHGLRLVGRRALNPLRLEKSYAVAGPDLNVEISALEAGLASSIAFDKGDFAGRGALMRQGNEGHLRRLVTLAIDTGGEASVLGHEGVYCDGRIAGRITSGAYSGELGYDVALALLPAEIATPGIALRVPILDAMVAARVIPDSPYDPDNTRCLM